MSTLFCISSKIRNGKHKIVKRVGKKENIRNLMIVETEKYIPGAFVYEFMNKLFIRLYNSKNDDKNILDE